MARGDAAVGYTASDFMQFVDQMLLTAPTTEEAERRLRSVITHCEQRMGHVAWYRDQKQSREGRNE